MVGGGGIITARDDVIVALSEKHDPRSVKWENRAILDTLQDVEPCIVSDLLKAVNERYGCELFTYSSLYANLHGLLMQQAVKNNSLTKKFSVSPDYITVEVRYLPVSNYCVALFIASTIALLLSVYFQVMVVQAILAIIIGALYLFGQYVGSEFKLNGLVVRIVSVLRTKTCFLKILKAKGADFWFLKLKK